MRHLFSVLCCVWALVTGTTAAAADLLEAERAFAASARLVDAQHIELRFDIAPGYYLYRDQFSVSTPSASVVLGEPQIPAGASKYDKTFNKEVAYFRESVRWVVPVQAAPSGAWVLVVGSRGCADQGVCYPPMKTVFDVQANAQHELVAITPQASSTGGLFSGLLKAPEATPPATPPAASAASAGAARTPLTAYDQVLQSRSWWGVVGLFALGGLLLSFTPCVWPMLPILSAMVVGQTGPVSRARGLTLAAAYSLGMAVVYTSLGILAAWLGESLAGVLQAPWMLSLLAALLVGLSLSMFDVYTLQLPYVWRQGLNVYAGRFKGGRYVSVVIMGALSALIVSPCIAPPLAGALVYIGQTHDVWLGGVALFCLAVGMSVPLLLLGLSFGELLPRAGVWMVQIKYFFGFALLAVALWMVSSVIPAWALMGLVAFWLLAAAAHVMRTNRFGWALAALMVLVALAQVVGLLSGGRSVWQPLAHLSGARADLSSRLNFTAVDTLSALDEAIEKSTQPIMLDIYADWCASCRELEALTLSQPSVQQALAHTTWLRFDITASRPEHAVLLRRYGLFGPPALLFLKPGGAEVAAHRLLGFESEPSFLERLAKVQAAP